MKQIRQRKMEVSRKAGKAILGAVAATVALIASGASASAYAPATILVPCRDSRGCPDLIVNGNVLHSAYLDTETFSSSDCAFQEGEVGGTGPRRLLKFPYQTPNLGHGSLIVGDPLDPANSDLFVWAPCHGHFHFRNYAAYRLWKPADFATFQQLEAQHPDMLSADIIAAYGLTPIFGTKKGFCVADAFPAPDFPGGTRDQRTYLLCGTATVHGNQGISVGWADEYVARLDGQWIDVTDVPDGGYVLDVETNPDHVFQEERYDNNEAFVSVNIHH
jgi:hypothetical protein